MKSKRKHHTKRNFSELSMTENLADHSFQGRALSAEGTLNQAERKRVLSPSPLTRAKCESDAKCNVAISGPI